MTIFRLVTIVLFCISMPLHAAKTAAIKNDLMLIEPAVTYHPSDYSPVSNKPQLTREHIVRDLNKLNANGFKSLVTYASVGELGLVPEIARQQAFSGTIIMGIWDPESLEEINNAIAQATYVDGYCIGNEGLGVRYETESLEIVMENIRNMTGKPVTTSEPIDSYLTGPYNKWLLTQSDWLFPLAHPFWANQADPEQSVNWIIARHDFLLANSHKTLMIKEAGIPTTGLGNYNEHSQIDFFNRMESTGIDFFYFEAFDQPWKRADQTNHDAEAHWGIYKADGTPKKIVGWLKDKYSTE